MANVEFLEVNIVLMCILLNYYIGSNNAGNSWGSAYCTRCLPLPKALLLGLAFEFLGGTLMTHQVQEIITSLFVMKFRSNEDNPFYYYSICTAAVVALISTSFAIAYQSPISTTQVCIFSMVGSSIALKLNKAGTYNEIAVIPFMKLAIVWLATPVLTVFVSSMRYWIIKKLILGNNARIRSFILTPYISGIVCVIYFSFVFTTPWYQDLNTKGKHIFTPIVLVLGFYIGIVFKRMHFFITKVTPAMNYCTFAKESLSVWSNKVFYNYQEKMNNVAEAYKSQARERKALEEINSSVLTESLNIQGSHIGTPANWYDGMKELDTIKISKYERQAFSRTLPGEEAFKLLLILTEIGMAITHGSNSNTIYLLFSGSFEHEDAWAWMLKAVCALSMGLGVYFSGPRLIKRIGTKFVTYANSCAFAAQFSAMTTTLFSSVIGYPVSTSQTYFFALLGIKLFHNEQKIVTMDKKLMRRMIVLWLTLPVACVLLPIALGELYYLIKVLN